MSILLYKVKLFDQMGCTESEVTNNDALKPVPEGRQSGKKMVWRLEEEEYSDVEPIVLHDPLADVDANPETDCNQKPKGVEDEMRRLVRSFFEKYDNDKNG